jgi:hypothetical protein
MNGQIISVEFMHELSPKHGSARTYNRWPIVVESGTASPGLISDNGWQVPDPPYDEVTSNVNPWHCWRSWLQILAHWPTEQRDARPVAFALPEEGAYTPMSAYFTKLDRPYWGSHHWNVPENRSNCTAVTWKTHWKRSLNLVLSCTMLSPLCCPVDRWSTSPLP